MNDYRQNKIYINSFEKCLSKLLSLGVKETDATVIADCFAIADSFNVQSHGSKLLEKYCEMILNKRFNMNPKFEIVSETPSFAKVNGDNSIGILAAKKCLELGIEKVKNTGIFTLISFNNNTIGPAFYYSLLAAEKNLICFVCSNSPAQMPALFGGAKKLLGTNPFSICFPVKNDYPIIIDMATSIVAKSKVKEYQENGRLLPNGWALDINGKPTNDPNEAIKGFILPMAGIKGYALSMTIDIIAGLLSGSSYLDNVGRFYSNKNESMNIGFSMVIIDPLIVLGEEYFSKIDEYINIIRSSPSKEKEIIIPGDDRIEFNKKFIL